MKRKLVQIKEQFAIIETKLNNTYLSERERKIGHILKKNAWVKENKEINCNI